MEQRSASSRWLLALVLPVAVVVALGTIKLRYQKAHHPAFVQEHHLYEGYVSIDNHVVRSQWMSEVLRSERSLEDLRGDLGTVMQPTALLVPALVASITASTGLDLVTAFAIVSALGTALLILCAALLARDLGSTATIAGLLCSAHVFTLRTSCQLHLDTVAAALAAGVAVMSLRRKWAVAWLLCLMAPLIKTSCLPCALIPAWTHWMLHRGQEGGRLKHSLRWAMLFVLPAAGVWLAAGFWIRRDLWPFEDGLHLMSTFGWNPANILRRGLEAALLVQVLFFFWDLSDRTVRWLLGCAILMAIPLILVGLPPVPRLYLTAVPFLVVAACRRLDRATYRTGFVWAFAIANVGVFSVATFLAPS